MTEETEDTNYPPEWDSPDWDGYDPACDDWDDSGEYPDGVEPPAS